MRARSIVLLLTLSLCSCASPRGGDGRFGWPSWHGLPKPVDCAALGAGLGAVIGGGGAAEHLDEGGSRGEAAAIGVGVAIAGGAIGYGVCRLAAFMPQETQVREADGALAPAVLSDVVPESAREVAPPPAPNSIEKIIANVCTLPTVLEGVNFESNSDAIVPEAVEALNALSQALEKCSNQRMRIEAHTDSQGPHAYNQDLSQRRADSVRDYLVRRGVRSGRLATIGFGEGRPIADNYTPEGRAKNRRVEAVPID